MTSHSEADLKRTPFAEGDVAMVYDQRKRRYRVELRSGALVETHLGYVTHDDIIGRHEGFFLVTNKGHRLFILRPPFADAVKELPRQSQVIYPKDLARAADARRRLPRRSRHRSRPRLGRRFSGPPPRCRTGRLGRLARGPRGGSRGGAA